MFSSLNEIGITFHSLHSGNIWNALLKIIGKKIILQI